MTASETDRRAAKTTIMVVDDTPANLALLEDLLGGRGYRVAAFPRGDLALKAAARKPPDLILLDILMPGMDGFEVCARLKADERLKDIPVLFITALSDTAAKLKAFAAGGVDYVTKPFQFDEVQARVDAHLRLRRLQAQLERSNQRLAEKVSAQVKEISDSQMATIFALAKLAEVRDDDTGRHIERTRTYCRLLAEKLREDPRFAVRIDERFIEDIFRAAALHDIGKVGIPDAILLKPGRLTPKAFEVVKTHCVIGARTLEEAYGSYPGNPFLRMGVDIARSHHENWDGSGYPDGLAGEDIPLAARIMALADAYDTLRSKRTYKEAFSHEKSRKIIAESAGRHFDPSVVDAFVALETEFAEMRERMDDATVHQSEKGPGP